MTSKKSLSPEQTETLIQTLKTRFEKHLQRHPNQDWQQVEEKLRNQADNLYSIFQMEETGGEPDVVELGDAVGKITFVDCVAESPKGRRSSCYDQEALDSRKEHKPKFSAQAMAAEMGISLLTEAEFIQLQQIEKLDLKTSSWLNTPAEVRKLGGAIFGDRRYDRVFIYHNGAESYYAARGFRGKLIVD